jgi:hypothetical protein
LTSPASGEFHFYNIMVTHVYPVSCFKGYRVSLVFRKHTVRILAGTPIVLRSTVVLLGLLCRYIDGALNNAATASFHNLSSLFFAENYSTL